MLQLQPVFGCKCSTPQLRAYFRDLFRRWGAQGELECRTLEFLKYIIGNSTKVLEHVQFPPPEEPALDNTAYSIPIYSILYM